MEPSDSIRRLGFARWYERRLIEGHAWFISGFMCLIAVAACAEELNFRGSPGRLFFYTAVLLCAIALALYGFQRYQQIMVEAESLGENATCIGCGAYARFRMVSASTAHCRKCDHEWRLIDTG